MNSFPYILTQRLTFQNIGLDVNVDTSNIHTMKQTLQALRIVLNHIVDARNVYAPEVFIRGYSWLEQNQKILEYLAYNKAFQSSAHWIYRTVILQCDKDTWVTGDVKLRIATSMMKCFFEKDDYIYVCDSIIANIKELRKCLIDEELPFQQHPCLQESSV